MRNYWLHFIGKSYYKMDEFIKESQEVGISRAVSLNIFKKMKLGDAIILAQWNEKYSEIFGYFVFDTIYGLDASNISDLEKAGIVEKNDDFQPVAVKKGCGSYVVAASYAIMNKEKLMEFIKNSDKEDFNRLMIGGKFQPISMLISQPVPFVKSNIPFQQGFRLFDFEAFKESTIINPKKVKGMFYCNEYQTTHFVEDSSLLVIENYKLN
jgi:hypothetical protein